MSDGLHRLLSTDAPALLAGLLVALLCALLGNFLVLRRQSLMGDAISHSVLPGLVIAFLIAGSRNPLPMFLGAAASGFATVVIVELVKRLGRVEPGAAMGVTFSVLFALGVYLIEQAPGGRHTDLDAECVLHGQLETIFWNPPQDWAAFWSWQTLAAVPRQVLTLGAALAASAVFVGLLYKELRLAAFDPGLCSALGFRATALHYALMAFVAAATVASFEAVGSILVIAMLICPAATARLLTDRLHSQIAVSLIAAGLAAVSGYFGAIFVPRALGLTSEVNIAGSITVASGALLTLAAIGSPRYGVIAGLLRRRALTRRIKVEDVLATLFRAHERGASPPAALDARAVRAAQEAGLVRRTEPLELTDQGHLAATDLVRRHRQWETYLVEEAGLRPDHVHEPAERLEHLSREEGARGVAPLAPAVDRATDPHGRAIPGTKPPG